MLSSTTKTYSTVISIFTIIFALGPVSEDFLRVRNTVRRPTNRATIYPNDALVTERLRSCTITYSFMGDGMIQQKFLRDFDSI